MVNELSKDNGYVFGTENMDVIIDIMERVIGFNVNEDSGMITYGKESVYFSFDGKYDITKREYDRYREIKDKMETNKYISDYDVKFVKWIEFKKSKCL